jgi:Tfp pilus assembly protein PilF
LSIEGVRLMVTATSKEDWAAALEQLKLAIAEDQDDHASHFAAGVCCEKMKEFDKALKHYKLARSIKPKEAQYGEAVERVTDVAG